MQSLLKVGLAAAFAATLFFCNPLFAQPADEVSALSEKIEELYNAARYAEAVPIAQQLLAIQEKALGPDHPALADTLNFLAVLYRNLARYPEAEFLYRRSLDIREKAFGHDHIDVAQSLNNLATLYMHQGRYVEAEPLFKRSLAIRQEILDADDPRIGTALNSLATLYDAQARYAESEPLYKRALTIREKAFGNDHPAVAEVLNNLAALYFDQGRYAEAEPLSKRSLAIREKILDRNDPRIATALENLASLYKELYRFNEAESLYRRSLTIRETVFGLDHPEVSDSLYGLGNLYYDFGQSEKAKPLYRRSLAIREKALGPDHPKVSSALQALALLDGNPEPLFQRALAIDEKAFGPNHPNFAKSLSFLAEWYTNQSRYSDAEPLYKRALAVRESVLGSDHRDVASSLTGLALLEMAQGRYAEAEPLLQRSLAINEKLLGSDHANVAGSLNQLAELYRNQKRYGKAEPLYQRSLAIFEKTDGPQSQAVAKLLNNLALLYSAQNRYGDAERLLQRSTAIIEAAFPSDSPTVAKSRHNLVLFYKEQGRYAEAVRLLGRILEEGYNNKMVDFPVLFAGAAKNLLVPQQALAASYEILQRLSSSAAGNAVSNLAARSAARGDNLAQIVRENQDLTTEAEVLDKKIIESLSKPPLQRSATAEQQIRNRLAEVKSEREKLQRTLNERFPNYVALANPRTLSLAETQALLSPDEALVVFDFADQSYAWIISSDDAAWTELKISNRELDAHVQKLRAWLTGDSRQQFDPVLAHRIYQETFGAFADKIASKKRLSVVTNGALTSLPPQLLITKDPAGKSFKEMGWLVRSHAVTILPSVASLKILRSSSQGSSARKPLIAFADPVFSKAARAQQVAMRSLTSFYRGTQVDVADIGEYLPQLPGTRLEVQQIADDLKANPTDIKLGMTATETAVKQAKLDQYRIIYFATHGLVAGDLETFAKDKAEPALALSIPEKPNDLDDGLLTASEIAQLKLDADWAVLSACNTAAEDKPGAEALSGLARAFFYAGARSLIVSHWAVSDEATARLMIGTFRASARDPKLSHAEALRQSMLAMIDAAKSDAEADPRLWAPFVVVGEPAKAQ
jgi:CHAT domain-containing protein